MPPPDETSNDPRKYRESARTRDGVTFTIRAIRPNDKGQMRAAFREVSKETIYRRFFELKRELTDRDLAYFTEVDFVRHVALVATFDDGGGERGAGVGRYVVEEGTDPLQAEAALLVVDHYQNRGIGTQLLYHLAEIARSAGVRVFTGQVLGENHKMMEVFLHSGYEIHRQVESGVVKVSFSIEVGADGPPRVFGPGG